MLDPNKQLPNIKKNKKRRRNKMKEIKLIAIKTKCNNSFPPQYLRGRFYRYTFKGNIK